MDDLNIATQFDGTFDLEFLRRGESVRSAGKDSKAVLVESGGRTIRLELHDWLIRKIDGGLVARKELP